MKLQALTESALSAMSIDNEQRVYTDIQNQVHVRSAILSNMIYVTDEQMQSLRRDETVVLELLTVNTNNAVGEWLNVIQ